LEYFCYWVDFFNIFLLGWVLKLCEFKYWGVKKADIHLCNNWLFILYYLFSFCWDYFLTIDVSDIKFCLHTRCCNEQFTGIFLHAKQELLTLPEHLSWTPVFSYGLVARSSVFFVEFRRSLFVLLLTIVLSVLLQFTVSDYPLVSSKEIILEKSND
jgi:hypothetical protein